MILEFKICLNELAVYKHSGNFNIDASHFNKLLFISNLAPDTLKVNVYWKGALFASCVI